MTKLLGALVATCLVFALWASSASAAFGIASFDGEVTAGPAGEPDTQAGSHPFAVSTTINFNTEEVEVEEGPGNFVRKTVPQDNIKNVDVELPAGLIGDPSAVPRCTAAQFAAPLGTPGCPENTQVGTTTIFTLGTKITLPVYNMVPAPGVPAQFGFVVLVDPVIATASVRSQEANGGEGYGLDIHLENISQGLPLTGTSLSFWGNPSDPRHDAERGACLSASQGQGPMPAGGCPYVDAPKKPFMTLPTSCTGPQTTRLHVTSWQGGEDRSAFTTHDKAGRVLGADGCDQVPFGGSIETSLGTPVADTPSALTVDLRIPQNTNPEGLATANLKKSVVTLPPGISINPSTANGLVGCSVAEFDQFSNAPSTCPQNSKIGTVEIVTPLLSQPLSGGIFLARQKENPFGSLIAIYVVAEAQGVLIKLPAEIALDPTTGRLVTTFDNTPQVPFDEFKLNFFGGPSAVLATPDVCGTQPSSAVLTPWSNAGDVGAGSSVTVSSGASGGGCVGSLGQRPFGLSLEAGTVSNAAALHSPFDFKVSRPDGAQEISTIEATLPQGVLATLRGVPQCSDAAAAAGSCGEGSRVGSVIAVAGAGTSPFYVKTGRAYLTGPYKGAPLGLDFVVPAVAGPLDLGTVNVRAGVFVDPTTAQVTVKADQLPRILDGIPLRLRSIELAVDRDGFMLNPTSCNPSTVSSHVTSYEGAGASLSDRFQAAGCGALGFAPKLAPKLLGGRKALNRRRHPALQVTVTEPKGQANISKVSFAMPHSILLDQSHIKTICTRVQFSARKCPKASVYGRAQVTTPLLDKPLTGPVYLRSSNHKLPDLVADLKGQFEIVLAGRIDSNRGGIRATFTNLPDAPIAKFVLNMQGGAKGLLQNSVNLCKASANGQNRATVKIDGQNGRTHDTNSLLSTACGGKGKKK